MPSRKFLVIWDLPDDENWMNAFNLQYALQKVCPNTKFAITDFTDPDNPIDALFSSPPDEEAP